MFISRLSLSGSIRIGLPLAARHQHGASCAEVHRTQCRGRRSDATRLARLQDSKRPWRRQEVTQEEHQRAEEVEREGASADRKRHQRTRKADKKGREEGCEGEEGGGRQEVKP